MRLFQNSGIYQSYATRLRALTRGSTAFAELRRVFLQDRYGASHILQPILTGDPDAFFTNGDNEALQRTWARENGVRAGAALEEILLAQIEAHRTDVFYNLDPVRYPGAFARKLPGSVKTTIAWHAAPSGGADFGAYDLIVCNFPSILEGYRRLGWRSAWFAPSYDPELDAYAANEDRPIDVLFVGGYSRHHRNRAAVLKAVAGLRAELRIEFCLDRGRLTMLADTPLGLAGPLKSYRRPQDIRAVSSGAVFGRQLYEKISRAKIVLNGAIDMAGSDRGNMRCWEAMGARALLVSDEGNYPAGMVDGETIRTYSSPEHAVEVIEESLAEAETRQRIANAGYEMVRTRYSSETQWKDFQRLAADHF